MLRLGPQHDRAVAGSHLLRGVDAEKAEAVFKDLHDGFRECEPFGFAFRSEDAVLVIKRVPGAGQLEKIEAKIMGGEIVQG